MKKAILKSVVFVVIFVLSVIVIGKIMNKDHNNLTMEMAPATFPIITMERDGIVYNEMHGYAETMETAYQRDHVTVLGENRDTAFTVHTYGRQVTAMSMQVRNVDGSRLIEDTPITDYTKSGEQIHAKVALKDLIEKDTEYIVTLVLELDGREEVYYYSRAIWSDKLAVTEKMSFVLDFHNKVYDKVAAKTLTKYLETNSKLEDNSSFHKVNIHSSFNQITWGDLNVREEGTPVLRLTEIAQQTASMLVDYFVSTGEGKEKVYYQVREHYRIRYTTDRIYLLDYERTMTQIPDVDRMYANDKILLGIADEHVPMLESEDGNIVVFETAGKLCSYNNNTNKLTVIFSFYDEENADARTLYPNYGIKILDADEGGNVQFVVYGYMNRGRHEGAVGVQLYHYDSALNTIEEVVYIPYSKSFAVLQAEIESLCYLNREQQMYFTLENKVYEVDLSQSTYRELVSIRQDGSMQVSENHKIIMWQEGNGIYHSNRLVVRNLGNGGQSVIKAGDGEAIRPLGFMGEDVIYGIAREADIVEENSGRIFFPMYKICICNPAGELLKEYYQDNIYITDCVVVDNQISLERLVRSENGTYQETYDDHIMNSIEAEVGKNKIVAPDIDVYERYVQIQTKGTIDSKTINILTPKEVVFEGGRELKLVPERDIRRYYVYGAYGVDGIYCAPGEAVNLAYENAGVVVSDSGNCMWLRGNRVVRNQIMAIKKEEVTPEKNSLVVCLDTILKFEGVIRNCEYLLAEGFTVMEILQDNLPNAQVMDLTGCELDAVLYYVNRDIPVLAMLENGEAVLVTGFNEYNVVIMEPSTGKLEKRGMNDTAEWFRENGNQFITYMPQD